jgi:hypothetical protein
MSSTDIGRFEQLVADFLADKITWDEVRQFALAMEARGTAELPSTRADDAGDEIAEAFDDLFISFIGEGDDTEFRLGKAEIQQLQDALHRARRQRP